MAEYASRAVGLIRVSGLLPPSCREGQEESIRDFAEGAGLDLVSIFIEEGEHDTGPLTQASIKRLVEFCEREKIETVLLESAERFSEKFEQAVKDRDLIESLGKLNVIWVSW